MLSVLGLGVSLSHPTGLPGWFERLELLQEGGKLRGRCQVP